MEQGAFLKQMLSPMGTSTTKEHLERICQVFLNTQYRPNLDLKRTSLNKISVNKPR
jgi:hypothetical protein